MLTVINICVVTVTGFPTRVAIIVIAVTGINGNVTSVQKAVIYKMLIATVIVIAAAEFNVVIAVGVRASAMRISGAIGAGGRRWRRGRAR